MCKGLEVREACCVAFRDVQRLRVARMWDSKPGDDNKKVGQVTRGYVICSSASCIVGAQ